MAVYEGRRARLLAELGDCLAVISSQGAVEGITEDFRQDADFFWLTGINEPDAHLVLQPKSAYRKVVLFLKSRDPEAERWTGPREPISPEMLKTYGVDRVRRGSPESTLLDAGLHHNCVAIISPAAVGKDERGDAEPALRMASRFGLKVVYKRGLLADTGLSYSSIVGSGPNGAVLHWDKNSRVLQNGDLVVVDAAAEYGRYASDVTRTYPVSGRFTADQARVYRAV